MTTEAEFDYEISRLRKALAKELSEDDEMGAEYVYVGVLKQELREARAELERMRVHVEAYKLGREAGEQRERERILGIIERLGLGRPDLNNAVCIDEMPKARKR